MESKAVNKTQIKYLPNKMVLYVPEFKVNADFLEAVSKLLGGYTSIEADGAWVDLKSS